MHLGHREVIAGSDTVLTFEPHPLAVIRPEAAPRLLTSLKAKVELVAQLGVQELVVIPFDGRFASQSPSEFIDHVLVDRAVGHPRLGRARTSASATAPRATRRCSPPTPRFATRVVELVEVDGRGRLLQPHPRAGLAPATSSRPARFLGAPFQMRGEVIHGRPPRAASSASQPPTSFPTTTWSCPGHGVYAARADGTLRGGQRRGTANVRRPAGRCSWRPTCSTRRGPLRPGQLADRLPLPAARRAAVRQRRGAGGADAPSTSRMSRALCG